MRHGFTLIELLICMAIVLIVFAGFGGGIVGVFGGCMPNYSDGERSGTVYKLSHKGMIWKSYEGEMNLGGMAADANGSMVPNQFAFSVTDPEVVDQINLAATSGNRVTIHYHQYLVKPMKLETQYVVDKVTTKLPLEKPQ